MATITDLFPHAAGFPDAPDGSGASGQAGGPPEERPGRARPVRHAVGVAVSAAALLVVVLVAVVVIIVPKVTGAVPLTVLTGSMTPTLPVGSLAVVEPVTPDEIRVGDIVSYQPYPLNPELVTHRVTAISWTPDGTRVFTLRGDANGADDSPVYDKQVRARVWYDVPYLGWVNNAVNGSHRSWFAWTAAGACFAYAAYNVVRGIRDRRDEKDDGLVGPTEPAEPAGSAGSAGS